MSEGIKWCKTCGSVLTPETNSARWEIYERLRDGRQSLEGLTFTSDWVQENVYDDESHENFIATMERDMYRRGLCVDCSLPDLRGITDDDIMSDEEAQEMHDLWAMERAERNAGC